jgi:nucleoside-diphosphate-sugar epimerase
MVSTVKNDSGLILVTGATGYIASHCIKMLLDQGNKVRGTVRSLANKEKYQFLYDLSPTNNNNLTIVEVDLLNSESWLNACEGVQYVLHIASPYPPLNPKDENEIIKPAVEGTINVLNASLQKGVSKVVVTSSCLALFFGNYGKTVSEDDWSDTSKCSHYSKSKTLAEKAAWEFYEKNKNSIQLTTVLPSFVLGPIFFSNGNSSETFLRETMKNKLLGIPDPDMNINTVDVRDVAIGHINALFTKETDGRRYIVSGSEISNEEIFNILKKEFGKYGYEFPSKKVTAQQMLDSGNPHAQRAVPMMGKKFPLTNERSIKELNMSYRSIDETLVDMGYSLIKLGVVENLVNK